MCNLTSNCEGKRLDKQTQTKARKCGNKKLQKIMKEILKFSERDRSRLSKQLASISEKYDRRRRDNRLLGKRIADLKKENNELFQELSQRKEQIKTLERNDSILISKDIENEIKDVGRDG